jgi:hypothetical protein
VQVPRTDHPQPQRFSPLVSQAETAPAVDLVLFLSRSPLFIGTSRAMASGARWARKTSPGRDSLLLTRPRREQARGRQGFDRELARTAGVRVATRDSRHSGHKVRSCSLCLFFSSQRAQ